MRDVIYRATPCVNMLIIFLDKIISFSGCQILLTPEIDGIVLRLPRATKNFYVDGHKPAPH